MPATHCTTYPLTYHLRATTCHLPPTTHHPPPGTATPLTTAPYPKSPSANTSTYPGNNTAGSSMAHGASASQHTQHDPTTPEYEPTPDQTTRPPADSLTDLTTYTTVRPCSIPVAIPTHIPTVSACTNADILDPRKIIALTFTAMDKPITQCRHTCARRIT